MEPRPPHHEAVATEWQPADDRLEGVDVVARHEAGELGMEVGPPRMVGLAEVHLDHDAVERAHPRHVVPVLTDRTRSYEIRTLPLKRGATTATAARCGVTRSRTRRRWRRPARGRS